jgi:hypothetical protein
MATKKIAAKKNTHGGAGRGQGRKGLGNETGEATVVVSVRMTESQRDKLAGLGGSAWVRKKIDMATVR